MLLSSRVLHSALKSTAEPIQVHTYFWQKRHKKHTLGLINELEYATTNTQTITLYEHLSLTYPIKETLEEPFEAVETGIVPLSIHVFLQSWQKLFHNFIMMILKPKKFRKSLNEETCKKKTHKLWMLSMNGRVENKSNSNHLCFRFMHSKKLQAGSEFHQNTYDGKKDEWEMQFG